MSWKCFVAQKEEWKLRQWLTLRIGLNPSVPSRRSIINFVSHQANVSRQLSYSFLKIIKLKFINNCYIISRRSRSKEKRKLNDTKLCDVIRFYYLRIFFRASISQCDEKVTALKSDKNNLVFKIVSFWSERSVERKIKTFAELCALKSVPNQTTWFCNFPCILRLAWCFSVFHQHMRQRNGA